MSVFVMLIGEMFACSASPPAAGPASRYLLGYRNKQAQQSALLKCSGCRLTILSDEPTDRKTGCGRCYVMYVLLRNVVTH